METSIFLAKVIGLFGAISTLAILTHYKKYIELESRAIKDPLAYMPGFVFLAVGILLTVSHQVWTWDWRVTITVIGWLVLIKGVLRVFFPGTVRKLVEKKRTDRQFLLAEVAVLIVSIYLVYQGFTAH